MNHEKAWVALKEKLRVADAVLTDMANETIGDEHVRLTRKRSGLRLALDWLDEFEREVDAEQEGSQAASVWRAAMEEARAQTEEALYKG